MPRPGLPLTPGSSTDIKGKDGTQHLASFQLSFELPPPALHDASRVSPPDGRAPTTMTTGARPMAPSTAASPTANFPMQPAETVKARRRSSAAKEAKDNTFALPPPPTRSRKIIQMKPRTHDDDGEGLVAKKETGKAQGKAPAASKGVAKAPSATTEPGKKKQPSANSAAGRKIARKTAHSLIERRRRSKMNEEFAVLKNMIPACTGEMHKLSILQASIEYVRYLEDCVAKLKSQQSDDHERPESGLQTPTGKEKLPSILEFHPSFHDDPNVDVDVDVDMSDSDAVSPTFTGRPSISPALPPQDARFRHHSYSSASTDQRHYSFSTNASPALGPQVHPGYYAPSSEASAPPSALTSPALRPQTDSDPDHEATAALLMLNKDRRGTSGSGGGGGGGRGLSVRDLLST